MDTTVFADMGSGDGGVFLVGGEHFVGDTGWMFFDD